MTQVNIVCIYLLVNIRSLFYGSFVLCFVYIFLHYYTLEQRFGQIRELKECNHWSDENEDWKSVGHSLYNFSVYSAYSFGDQEVVIIGTPNPFKPIAGAGEQHVQCAFYWNCVNSTTCEKVVRTQAKMETMIGWMLVYAGTFTRCIIPLQSDVISTSLQLPTQNPQFVSILLGNQTESPARLPIQYRTYFEDHYPSQFSVCVLPLYGYNDVFHFVEWLEFYRMMGVERFTFYNRSIGPSTSCVMRNVENMHLGVKVVVKPWHNYPQKNDADIRFGLGLSAGANECLYSSKGVTKYMIFVDVDEFIVPLQGIENYTQLISFIHSQSEPSKIGNKTTHLGQYAFRNGFYVKSRESDPTISERCATVNDDPLGYMICQNMWTMKLFQREQLYNWGSRTKYIAVPEGVRNAGNHYVLEYERDWSGVNVPATIAFSRHYRAFKEGNETFVERMPQGMGSRLAMNVARSMEYVMNACNLTAKEVFG